MHSNQVVPMYGDNSNPSLFQEFTVKAKQNGTTPAFEALQADQKHMLTSALLWPEPQYIDQDDGRYSQPTMFNQAIDGPLTNFVKSLAKSIQFPVNTAYLHGLGVVSSAMNKAFKYNYYGQEKPTNLYVITAQPPSSGKSGINSALVEPVRKAYKEIADNNAVARAAIHRKIAGKNKALEKAGFDGEVEALTGEIHELQKELESIPEWVHAVDDATPEALENIASQQQGMFNVISDEADAINIILGKVYGEGKSNYGIFLKGWDGDFHSPARITRATKPGHVYGSIAVIAQDESIDSILEAGMSGRGISERIIMLREKSMLGKRKHDKFHPVGQTTRENYHKLIENIVNQDEKVVLTFSKEAEEMICGYKTRSEIELGDDGIYSNNMLRGVIGKADKQIRKLASVLHVSDRWHSKSKQATEIDGETVMRAVMMFSNMVDTYIDAADSQGVLGASAELSTLINAITRHSEKKGLQMRIRALRDNVKKQNVFKNLPMLSDKLRTEYLPELERMGFILVDGQVIHINPQVK